MKKALFILLLTMGANQLLNAQDGTPVQTKEETLEWLRQNRGFSDFMFGHCYSFDFQEDKIVLWRRYCDADNGSCDSIVHYKDILWTENLDDLMMHEVEGQMVVVEVPVKGEQIFACKDDGSLDGKAWGSSNGVFSFFYEGDSSKYPDAKKNLFQIIGSVMHIAKLSGAESLKNYLSGKK